MEDISLGPAVMQGQQTPEPTEEIAVMIRDAVKMYDKNNVVLKGLNMTVPKGKM